MTEVLIQGLNAQKSPELPANARNHDDSKYLVAIMQISKISFHLSLL